MKASSKKKFTLLLVSLVIAFALGEVLMRVHIFGFKGLSYTMLDSVQDIALSGLIQPGSNLELIYELKPNLNSYFKMVELRTNSMGLRDNEYYPVKGENVFRVAVIGDSFTMPAGVRIEDAFFKLIENRVNSKSSGRKYQFINFAVGGYCLRQYVAVARYKAKNFNPDLILLGWCEENDHLPFPQEEYKRRYQVKPRSSGFTTSYLFLVGSEMVRYWLSKEAPRQTMDYTPADLDYMKTMFQNLRQVAGETPVLVVQLGFRTHRTRQLEEFVKRSGFHFVDSTAAFANKDNSHLIIHKLDGHPNAKAHRIIAEVVHKYLIDNHLLQ